MPDTTTEALYKVGQLVEWRGGEDRPFERTGRVTRVFSTSDPAAGGWQYAIEAAGPRGMENPGKWQTNVRPFFEAGDVVRVGNDPKCQEERDSDGDPSGYVDDAFCDREATVNGTRRLRSNYEVQLPNGDVNWIAPEFLTLVRKAGETAAAAPTYRYAADGWRPQVGDHIEVRIHASAQWQDYGTITDVGTDLSYAETDLPSGITGHVTRDHYEAGHVRLVVEAPGETTLPTTFSEGWRPQVGDVVRLDYEDGREVTVRHLYPNSDDFGFDYSEQRWGSTVSNTYVRDDQVRLVRRPGAEPERPKLAEPWDISKVQVGDKVEVYAGAGGYPASSPEAAAHREPRLSWQEGVVMSVDSGDRSLTLRVRVNGVDSWWHYNENVRPVQTAAPAAAPAPDVQAAIDKALAEYKAQVRDVALKAAQENDWCSQTEACLKELGIDPQTQYAAEVTVTFKVSAKVAEDYTRSGIENPARFLKDHLTPTLTTRYGLSSADVAIERVQINNVTKN